MLSERSRPSKRVSGRKSRARQQKCPWPAPTSSQRRGLAKFATRRARARYSFISLTQTVFASEMKEYRARARLVANFAKPRRWLDVGAGHGHFCCLARDFLPDTRFEGLDLSESIDHAVKRKWVDRGIRGLFPEI